MYLRLPEFFKSKPFKFFFSFPRNKRNYRLAVISYLSPFVQNFHPFFLVTIRPTRPRFGSRKRCAQIQSIGNKVCSVIGSTSVQQHIIVYRRFMLTHNQCFSGYQHPDRCNKSYPFPPNDVSRMSFSSRLSSEMSFILSSSRMVKNMAWL